jgi:hypothetical protein
MGNPKDRAKRGQNRLAAIFVAKAKPGQHSDGKGLYLRVSPSGSRQWVFHFTFPGGSGRVTEMGLGSANSVTLAEARRLADEARREVAAGRSPVDARREAAQIAAGRLTFGQCADAFLEAKSSEWRNDKHHAQWAMTLRNYAGPLRRQADRRNRH